VIDVGYLVYNKVFTEHVSVSLDIPYAYISKPPYLENNSENDLSDLEARKTIDEPVTAPNAPVVQTEWGNPKSCNLMQPLAALQDEGTTTSDRGRVLLKAHAKSFFDIYSFQNTLLPMYTLNTKLSKMPGLNTNNTGPQRNVRQSRPKSKLPSRQIVRRQPLHPVH
jgi:hypothetical protein